MNDSWVGVQKKTFTRWCNTYLIERMLNINDLATDFHDGLLLINLLEIISSKSIRHNKNPRLIPQKLENLKFALDFLQQEGIKLVNIGPTDLVEGNLKLILGLIWTIILRYQIQLSQGASAKQELLDWVRSKIPEYNINNFTRDWQDGKAICALAEAVLPGQMNLPADFRSDPVANASMGIQSAEKNMKIPPILDAEDMVYNPDELSNMTYISYFRDYLDLAAREQEESLIRATPVAGKCLAHGPGVEPGNEAGIETYFTIEAINARGQRVTGPPYPHQFPVKIVGPAGEVPSETVNNNDGTYRVTYTPTVQGNHTIEVTFKGNHIQKSPFQIYVNPSRPDPVKCRCYGPGLESAEAHTPAEFTIEAVNRLGDRIPNGGHPFHVEVVDPYDVRTPANIVDNHDGTYTVSYNPTDPGDHIVHVSLGRDKVADSPYKVPVGWNSNMACPHLSYAAGPGLEPGHKNTEPAVFTIYAVKPDGTPQTNGGDLFDVHIEDPNKELIAPKITDNGDGTYNVEYQPTLPGPYHIDVIQRNPDKPLFYDHIKDSPVDISIVPGTDPSQTIAYGPGLEPGNSDTKPAEFTIRAKDILGNDIKEGGDPFDVKIDGPSGPVAAEVRDNGDGTYTVSYQPEAAGPHDLAVTLDDVHIKGSKFHVDIKPGAWPEKSTIENYTFVVRTVDRKGRNKLFGGEKVEVVVARPSGSLIENVKVDDQRNGTYKVSYKLDGEESGNYQVSVMINGEHISGSPFVQSVV